MAKITKTEKTAKTPRTRENKAKDDPAMPMGENGNELVETIDMMAMAAPGVDVEANTEATAAPDPAFEIVSTGFVAGVEQFSTTVGIESAETIDNLDPMELELLANETLEPDELADKVVEHEASAEDPVLEPQANSNPDNRSFDEIVASITDDERRAATIAMAKAVDERIAFERTHGSENIQKTLKSARTAFTDTRSGAVLLACSVDESFVNRSVSGEARYNVYAFGKLADAIRGLRGDAITNKINLAIMRSLFAARKAGIGFTAEMAKMAASDKIRVADAAIKAILVRHTVAESTAATQASSTMQALETLGIVKRDGSHRNPTFTLTDAPQTAKLEEVLMKAA